jgi:hypothetical protein
VAAPIAVFREREPRAPTLAGGAAGLGAPAGFSRQMPSVCIVFFASDRLRRIAYWAWKSGARASDVTSLKP